MSAFLDNGGKALAATQRFLIAAGGGLRAAAKFLIAWLSVPFNACIALVVGLFLFSVLYWAIAVPYTQTVLFFPEGGNGVLRGEVRDLPRHWDQEARAEIVARELILGPANPRLAPDFPPGTALRSILLRGNKVFVDLSVDAALAGRSSLERGKQGLELSLKTALPGIGAIVVTIGGLQPYQEALADEAGKDEKKPKNN